MIKANWDKETQKRLIRLCISESIADTSDCIYENLCYNLVMIYKYRGVYGKY